MDGIHWALGIWLHRCCRLYIGEEGVNQPDVELRPPEREILEVDVLFVGAGPATLASAYHLVETCAARGLEAPSVLVIEKGAEVGDHLLSGAVINPRAIQELMPDFVEQGFPTEYVCTKDMSYFFLADAAIRLPVNLPFVRKKGYHVASLYNVARWLATKCEEKRIEVYPGFADSIVCSSDCPSCARAVRAEKASVPSRRATAILRISSSVVFADACNRSKQAAH